MNFASAKPVIFSTACVRQRALTAGCAWKEERKLQDGEQKPSAVRQLRITSYAVACVMCVSILWDMQGSMSEITSFFYFCLKIPNLFILAVQQAKLHRMFLKAIRTLSV